MWMVTVQGEHEDFGDWPVEGAEEREGHTRVYFSSRTVARAFAQAFGGKLERAVWEVDLAYQAEWKAEPVGERWWLVPEGEELVAPAGRRPLRRRRGLVFGGGDHATTQAMLELLEQVELAGKRVLDLGTGTGILSEAARWMGARGVAACDTDAEAAAMAQAALGGWGSAAVWHGPSGAARDQCCDVLLVNIPGYVHLDLAPEYGRLLRRPGELLLSGYYEWQRERIEAALGKGFRKQRELLRGDAWVGAYFVCA